MERSLKAICLLVLLVSVIVGLGTGLLQESILSFVPILVLLCLLAFFDAGLFPSIMGEDGVFTVSVQGKRGRTLQLLFFALIVVLWSLPAIGIVLSKSFWVIPSFLVSVIYVVWLFAHGIKKKKTPEQQA